MVNSPSTSPAAYEAQSVYLSSSRPLSRNKSVRKISNYKALRTQDLQFAFQHYSGKGRLHSFRRADFSSFLAYSQAKQKVEKGQFFTPDSICELIIDMLEIQPGAKVADICSGKGSFFNFLPNQELYGVEIDDEAHQISTKLFPQADIQHCSMSAMKPIPQCDFIVGNPPFNIDIHAPNHPFSFNSGNVLSQNMHLQLCHRYLKNNGSLALVCPNYGKNTASKKVMRFFWQKFHVQAVVVLPNGIFQGTNTSTKILIAQKKSESYQQLMPFFQIKFINKEQVLNQWRQSAQYQLFKIMKGEV